MVEILDIGPHSGHEWGYTAIFTPENGSSFLPDHFKEAHKAIWHFEGRYCHSRHIPGVRFAGQIHPGLIGCSPSHELMNEWVKRENQLISTNPHRVPPLATAPYA